MQLSERKLLEIRKEAEEKYPVNYITEQGYFAKAKQEGYKAGAAAEALKSLAIEQERDELKKELLKVYHDWREVEKKNREIAGEREMYREALEKILDIQESDLYLNKKSVQLIFEINQIIGEALSTDPTDKNVSQKNKGQER